MIELSLYDFIAHCEHKGETEVDHSNWSSCAIGTYLDSVGIPVSLGYKNPHNLVPEEYSVVVEKFIEEIPRDILFALDDKSELLDTYASLADALKRFS